jgi:hypothetical protein
MDYEYTRQADKVEVKVKTRAGEVIDTFKWDMTNKQLEKKMYFILKNKYGIFKPEVEPRDKDLEWLDKV